MLCFIAQFLEVNRYLEYFAGMSPSPAPARPTWGVTDDSSHLFQPEPTGMGVSPQERHSHLTCDTGRLISHLLHLIALAAEGGEELTKSPECPQSHSASTQLSACCFGPRGTVLQCSPPCVLGPREPTVAQVTWGSDALDMWRV